MVFQTGGSNVKRRINFFNLASWNFIKSFRATGTPANH
jgi:hypothetical protein